MKTESNKKQVPAKVDSIMQYDEKLYIKDDGGYLIKTKDADAGKLCDALNIHFGFIEATLWAIDSAVHSDMELEPDNVIQIIFEANHKMEDIKKIHEEVFKRLG